MAEAEASRVKNGYDSNGSGPRLAQAVRECTYPDFLKCQPLNFKGTEGVVGLTQWFEKTESVFNNSNYTSTCQVKYVACTLQGVALTWWNSHVKTVTLEVAQALPWKTLKKMMIDKYCPRGEIKKLETEMWELKTKGTDVIGYSRHFQELVLMYDRMFPEESERVEKYIGGLPDMIHDSVKETKPKIMHAAIEFTTELMDKRIRDVVENKQKFEGTSGNNQNQPQLNKRQNTGQAYAAGNSDRNIYTGSKPLCSKCDYHHEGPCPPRCNNCKRVGHLTRDCRSRSAGQPPPPAACRPPPKNFSDEIFPANPKLLLPPYTTSPPFTPLSTPLATTSTAFPPQPPLTPATTACATATTVAFPAAAAAVAGCGWQFGHHRRGGAYTTSDLGLSATKLPPWWRSDNDTATTAAPCGVGLVVVIP
nr:hypothetical protein [Tanacetum cinerariifolium]